MFYTFIKFNWKPTIILSSGIYNSVMLYYQSNIQGYKGYPPIVEWCDENHHIFQSSYHEKGINQLLIITNISITILFGGLSIPIMSYMTYNNYLKNKSFKSDKNCLCGK